MARCIDRDKLRMYCLITRLTIVICWVALIMFWAIKLFGYNAFQIMVDNPNFIWLSDFVENSWLAYVSSFVTTFIAKYLTFGAICQKFVFRGKALLAIFVMIVSIWAVINFLNVGFLNMWYAYILMVIVGVVANKGWKRTFGLIAVGLDFVFSTLSILTRNIELNIITDVFTLWVLAIDIYIMYLLYYLYSNLLRMKKEI